MHDIVFYVVFVFENGVGEDVEYVSGYMKIFDLI